MNLPPLPIPAIHERSPGGRNLFAYSESQIQDYARTAVKAALEEAEAELARLTRIFIAERDAARAQRDHATMILAGIHGLLYPPLVTVGQVVYRFAPGTAENDMQNLSDAIRAIPDQSANFCAE